MANITTATAENPNEQIMLGTDVIAYLSAHIRPEKGVSVSVEIFDAAACAEHAEDIRARAGVFFERALARANELSIPAPLHVEV